MLTIWTNGVDTVIAGGLEDAMLVCHETSGEPLDVAREAWEDPYEEVRSYSSDEKFTVWFEDEDSAFTIPETHLVSEWVALRGRGYLACTEY